MTRIRNVFMLIVAVAVRMKRLPTIFAVLLLAPLVATFAAETNTSPVERRFQAIVVSVDPARQTVRVRHKPTGFETEVVWDEKSVVRGQVKYDIDEVSEGWVDCWPAEIDPKKKTVSRIGILQSLPNSAQPPAKASEVKEKSMIRCKLVRVPVDEAIRKDHERILTRNKDAAYELEANGERWALVNHFGLHPRLTKEVVLTTSDLKANLPCRELVYREEGGRNRLVSATVLPNQSFRPEEWPPLGPTGTTVSRLEEELKRFRDSHAKLAAEFRKVKPVKFRLGPEIVLQGEPITLTIEAWAVKQPNAQLVLEGSYLQPTIASKITLALDWKANEQADGLTRYTTELKMPALPVGQHCVTWTCDIGGDIPEFWRSFAVTDAKTLVAMFHFTSGKPNSEFDQIRLPYDYWEHHVQNMTGGVFGERKPPATAEAWVGRSREYRRRGASPNIFLCGAGYAGGSSKLPYLVNFSAEPEEVQRAVLKTVRELADMTGFQADDLGFAGYEFGTRTLAMAREAGVRLIGSMCIHQNWRDGGAWTINHSARPLRPYFAGVDDFRKTGPGGKDGVVMVSQHDKSILWTEYGVGVYEPCWLEVAWLGGGGGREKVFDEMFLSRHLDLFSAAIENVKNMKVPFFQSIGIEFSKADPDEMITRSNGLMIRYAVDRAKDGSVVFCHQAAAADFYRRHYQETPETLFYDADFWCGNRANESITSTWKPVDYPDLMHIENHRYSAFFKKPAALPEYHWDYTRPWDYPDWGNEQLARSPAGFLVPGEHDKFAVTPKIIDTRGMKVAHRMSDSADGLEIVVTLETTEAVKALPLALWDLPREWKPGEGWWSTAGANRFVPLRAPYTDNLNGILEVDAQPGKNEYRLAITTPQRVPLSQDIRLETVHAKVFTRDGQTMAYVWPMQPWETAFELDVPTGKPVQYYAAPKGERVDLKPGKNRLVIAQERWSRIVGLSYEELVKGLRSLEDAEKQDQPPPSDKRLLKNVDTLNPAGQSAKPLPAIDKLEAELATLWDWEQQGKRPLNPEVVFSAVKNGYKTEGIYINGYGDADGQDRLFFYYSRPESGDKKGPLYIDLTGGGEAERSTWIARTYQCAVIDIEWRAFKNKFSSKWAAGKLGSMKEITSHKNNMVFRLISGIRRAIDFASQQPGTDMERLGCGGGSMGGYYTLLAAGVDPRIRFGMDELGAGYLGQTDSSLGQFDLPPEYKALWIKAFDPYSYAGKTRARMLMNLAANDYFFWLADGIKNFEALAGEKTLCISPNFNHVDGCYGVTKYNPMDWLPYALGHETAYPVIASATQDGATYRVATQPGVTIQNATLYWSPGRDIVWPARYWLAVPAAFQDGVWQAEVPSRFAALERWAFMNVRSDKGRTASSLPTFTAGVNPRETAGGWWPRGQLWDVEAGPGAWRPVGPNRHSGVAPAQVAKADAGGIFVAPDPQRKNAFALVTSSVALACGEARARAGLRIDVDAGAQLGEITVTLVRNFAAVQAQREFSCVVRYAAGVQRIEVPWSEFACAADPDAKLFPFDNLRLDGTRADGSALVLRGIMFF